MENIRVACAFIVRSDHVLITRRPAHKDLPNLWEFPGGKIHDGESGEEAVRREIREELGIAVEVERPLHALEYCYADGRNRRHQLFFFLCTAAENSRPEALEVKEWRWVPISALNQYEFPKADEEFLKLLPSILEGGRHEN